MSDTQDQVRKPGKLSLGKAIDSARLKKNIEQRQKNVKVEVRKSRSGGKPETGRPESVPNIKPEAETKEDRTLTRAEMEARKKVLERAHETKGEEDRRREEERQRFQNLTRRQKEEREKKEAASVLPPAVPVEALLPEAEESRGWGIVKKKKKDDDVFDETDEAGGAHKKSAGKKRRRNMDDEGEIGDIDVYSAAELLREEQELLDEAERRRLLIEEVDEFEDYSEDVQEESEEQAIVAKVQKVDDDRDKVVRRINTSERVIVSAADPNKIKKYLRSEAPVAKPKLRRPETPSAAAPAAPAPKPQPIRSRRRSSKPREAQHTPREVVIPETIVVAELANRMAVRVADVIKELMKMGVMANQNQSIEADTAQLVVEELGHIPVRVSEAHAVESLFEQKEQDDPKTLKPRAPVVTVMGHVDHGKTSLLDALRKTDVVAGEAGGITQHIGAYQVETGTGQKVTFIDTPGHEAFTAMRARGAKVTDIVVLVVAADDGIKQQTVEAINHAKAAGVPIIVAVNKIDKPGADPMRVRSDLMNYELVTENFGGEVIAVDVSAKQGTNLDQLVESILVQAEVLELKANPNVPASGVVIEARMEKGRGVMATLLVQRGTLKVGDIVVAGASWGRVRALVDDHGKTKKDAGPAVPVEMLGFDEVPGAGEPFAVAKSERDAREAVDYRLKKQLEAKSSPAQRLSLEELFSGGKAKVKELPVIVKADVHGSLEAITSSLEKIESDEVKVRIIHGAVGGITESDVSLAEASNAIILAFNVRANTQAKEQAAREKISIEYYSVIYDLVDNVKKALSGLLAPQFKENFLGYAEIREVFNVTKAGKVAGCMVTQGTIKRGSKVRLLRDNVVIHEGTLKTLKRFKDDVKDVREGFECGMAFENYDDIRAGDVIEAFELEQIQRSV